jgi:hypothetical protein
LQDNGLVGISQGLAALRDFKSGLCRLRVAGFIVNGATPAQNSALASAGAELRLANGVSLLGKFDGEFASHSTTYGGTGTIRYRW